MSVTYLKPENALKRCDEFIGVGQRNAALEVLEAVIKSKRHRQWMPVLEDILKKFLSLCTEMRQNRKAKDGLIQYRQIAQNVPNGPESILKVVTSFIGDGEKAVREAEEKAGLGADSVANLQDLEAEETPETMIVSVLTGDLSDTGRADRDNYVQWLRFLWESYRTCLEVLKNNSKLEELYADTAKKTFNFCVNYKRKLEFRRLKDLLKTHLYNAQLSHAIALNSETSLRLRLEVRVEQLNAATKLELWQLAFESAEELHDVINHQSNKKSFKSKAMRDFYEKLGQVFWVSENYLFHACALLKIYHLIERQAVREARTDGSKEKSEALLPSLASKLLLAAIAVPPLPTKSYEVDFDPEKDKQQRMATLVGHSSIPSRKTVLADLMARNVCGVAYPELGTLFSILENDFEPLSLAGKVKPILDFVESKEELVKYLVPLKKIILLKLVQQLSDVYSSMRISDFARLAEFMTLHDCEKFIVDAVGRGQIFVRLDHKNGTINFGDNGLESDVMRRQLTLFSKGLQGVLDMVQVKLHEQVSKQKAVAFKQLADSLDDERKMMLMRRQQIEDRKEEMEREIQMKAQFEENKRLKEEQERRDQEAKRTEEEKQRREDAKKREIENLKELESKKKLIEAIQSKPKSKKQVPSESDTKGKGIEDLDDDALMNIDKNELLKQKKDLEEKLKREAEERLQLQVQKLDHLERARREHERDHLVKLFEEQMKEDKIRWEIESKQAVESQKLKHEQDLIVKQQLIRMKEDGAEFEAIVRDRRQKEYTAALEAYKEQKRKEKDRILREREEKERKEREEREEAERKEAEKKRKDEEERRKREEERARLDAAAEKQRQKEAEIEEKQRKRDQEAAGPKGDGGLARPGGWGGGGGSRGGFGDRFGDRGGPDRGGPGGDRPGPRDGPRDGGDRWGSGGPRRDEGGGGFGDRGDGGRGGAGGDRWGDRDRGGGDRGFGDRGGFGGDRGGDRYGGDRGGDRGGFGDRGGDRYGGGGDRYGGGGGDRYGDRGGGGGGGDRYGGGGGDRFGGDRGGDRFGGGDRGDRGGDRYGGGGDRFGGGGGGGGGGDRWGSGRRDDGPPPRDSDAPKERPRLNLAPRSVPKTDGSAAPQQSDDGFTAVSKRR